MTQVNVRQWIDRIGRGRSVPNLAQLGVELGQDDALTQADYETVLAGASKVASGMVLADVIGSSIELRSCPPQEFWEELILCAQDPEIGSRILRHLVPFMDVTSLLKSLLAQAVKGNGETQRRVANTLYGATGVVTKSLQTGDVFLSAEALRKGDILSQLEAAIPLFKDSNDQLLLRVARSALSQS